MLKFKSHRTDGLFQNEHQHVHAVNGLFSHNVHQKRPEAGEGEGQQSVEDILNRVESEKAAEVSVRATSPRSPRPRSKRRDQCNDLRKAIEKLQQDTAQQNRVSYFNYRKAWESGRLQPDP